jgi:hypothetical protein
VLLPLAQPQGRPNLSRKLCALGKELQRGLEGQVLVQYMHQPQSERVQREQRGQLEQVQAWLEQVQARLEQAQAQLEQVQVQAPLSL